ncbi:iron uptake system protein EfeO [Pantoea sp. Aalb]|uniref:iron uptake system protein EfeO n=1 Tax=Pantoea sp. Aalb TaxID=2576762 RepID=UPI00132957A8|nr:iron uptake system protein EfeO [Pantoea sp. Aalb]MXP67344.1 iron uptake system protein EfeO [Pantoea sp. Aalb]
MTIYSYCKVLLILILMYSRITHAIGIQQVTVTVTDTKCDPMLINLNSGKTQFIIKNNSQKILEWEILKGVMIIEERENIAPSFSQKLTTNLQAGQYDITCGLLKNPKGKLIVKDNNINNNLSMHINPTLIKLNGPIRDYKIYVTQEVKALVKNTQKFIDAINLGKLQKAKELYAPTRQHYEHIEPIAELFFDLDHRIDAREDNYEKKANDPEFSGFHRLEKALFYDHNLKGMQFYANQLNEDVHDLQKRVNALTFSPIKLVGGAASLLEEVASKKISGEEDRYSRTDLWDFHANIEGAQKIVDLLRPLLYKENTQLVNKIDINFKKVNSILNKYRIKNGFSPYNQLTNIDYNALKGPINTLAENLSLLRGTLGLD